ncbi:MAG: peptidase and DD-carboxypeptidase VanY/endolysin [Nonomuraea muscovyensis]|nr:peptidase and DD-carboxypeptidase VanY/endolysin [Nonomuraea muscovyensis]
MASSNGKLTKDERTPLKSAPGQELEEDGAASWDRLWDAMVSTYAWPMVLTDSYRPLEVQQEIFLDRYRPAATGSGPFNDVRSYNGRRYVRVTGAAAAVPGTSKHGWGRAVDIAGVGDFHSARYRALVELAPHFGWSNAAGRTIGEYWHWEFTAANDKSADEPTPRPLEVTRDDIKAMQRAVHVEDDGRWGPNTDKATISVREASRWGKGQFPWGYGTVQRAMGRPVSGKWGPADIEAHDATVAAIQRVLGVADDGVWGERTESKFQRFRAAARK